MSNMHDCLEVMIKAGELPADRARLAQAAYAKLRDRYAQIMDPNQASARAAADIKAAVSKSERQRFHKVVNQLQAMRRIKDLVEATPDPSNAITGLMRQAEGHGFKGESVQSLTEAYEDSIRADLSAVMEEVGLNMLGSSRNKARMEDIVREMKGEATGDATAKQLAQVVEKAEARMVRAFNAQGGDIKILKNRGMMQTHDVHALRKAGFDAWAAKIEQQLDWSLIDDLSTGQAFGSKGAVPPRAETERFLREVYDGITTRGWDDREPAMTIGGKALYNQRADHRVLHFKDGTAQLAYNAEFGSSDPFSALMHSLNGMARDVALMRILGPNPRMGLDYAEQVAKKQAAVLRDGALEARVTRSAKLAKAMYAHASGGASMPEHEGWARFFAGTRAVLASAQLGSAVLSSVTDVATITMAAQTVGMNARNVLSKSIKLTASAATRQTAARMGYVAEVMGDTGGGAARFAGKIFGTGLTDRLAGLTLRASGLTFVTDMRKIAFQMEFSGHMADNAGQAFDQIDAPLRAMFEARGITARDWDLLRDPATRFTAPGGADFITPFHWLETQTAVPRAEAEGLALRLQMAIREQLEYAVPTASLEGRARMIGSSAPGSISGELLRSSMSYKSFSLSLMLGQYRRFMNIPVGAGLSGYAARAAYAAKMSSLLILTGALAIQLKELAKGNDPRPMDSAKFWMAAQFQGGGLGIFGDFFSAETSRVGGGLAETIAGPVVGAMGDVLGPVASNTTSAINGDKTHWGRDAANYLRGNTPVASSLWYARTAYSRLVADNLQAFLDPEADTLFQRRLRKQQKDYGTQPFIPQRGTKTELRLPDLSNAFGAQK
jgi:hypothetical protein